MANESIGRFDGRTNRFDHRSRERREIHRDRCGRALLALFRAADFVNLFVRYRDTRLPSPFAIPITRSGPSAPAAES